MGLGGDGERRAPFGSSSLLAFALLCAGLLLGCGGDPGSPSPQPAPAEPSAIVLTDATESSGLDHVHVNGASPQRYLPETMGSGVAFFDADGDGAPDLYLPNAVPLTAGAEEQRPGAFYRNSGDGTFEEAGERSGLAEPFFGLGTAVGDLDNDGDLDLFVTGLDGDRCYRNLGDGTFEDATAELGFTDRGFGASAAFLDYDRDGFLDLLVGRYVTWTRETDVACSPDGEHRSYCTPEVYEGQSNRLYRNLGGEGFEDVTEAAGLLSPGGKTLGVAVLDHQGDGWPDLLMANDTSRNALYLNQGDGTFADAAVELGVAFSLSGATRGAMGVDVGDLDGDGAAELVIGNFAHELAALYRPSEHGLYRDDANQLGVGLPTLMSLTFGTLVVDLDNDGWLDVVFANGHIEPDVERFQPAQSYAQELQIFRNLGQGKGFEAVPPGSWAGPWVARGLAAGDADGDGDLDLVLTQNGGATRLLRNDSPPRSWLRLRLHGTESNRTAYGTEVTAIAGDRRLVRTLTSGRSYLSASELVLHFGLGDLEALDALEIRWPSGREQRIEQPELGRVLVVEEPSEP
ncbi:MAG: CRTAC1 family protein [Acidobacteriota bacterium]|nr:CRTAC1 family protein [Acidobacteriota bacterium]